MKVSPRGLPVRSLSAIFSKDDQDSLICPVRCLRFCLDRSQRRKLPVHRRLPLPLRVDLARDILLLLCLVGWHLRLLWPMRRQRSRPLFFPGLGRTKRGSLRPRSLSRMQLPLLTFFKRLRRLTTGCAGSGQPQLSGLPLRSDFLRW